MKMQAWVPFGIAFSMLAGGCSSEMVRDLLSAQLATIKAQQAETSSVHGSTIPDQNQSKRPAVDQRIGEALRSPADVSGKWFVCGEQDDRFELQPANSNSNLVVGVPYRQGKPIGRLEGHVDGDRLKLTAHLNSTQFGPSPMSFEYMLAGDLLKETTSRGPVLSRSVQSGTLCGGPTGSQAYPDPDHYPDPDGAYPDPDGVYPDPDGAYPDPDGAYPDPDGVYPDPDTAYPNQTAN